MKASIKARILDRIRSFPAMPGSVQRLLTSLSDEDTELEDLEETIRYDPGLTANLLHLANSVHFGCAGEIGSIKDAIVRLGRKRLANLTLTASVGPTLERHVSGYEIPAGQLWRHSLAVASAAEELSRRVTGGHKEDVFTPALLHDIGKLVMGEFIDEAIPEIEEAIAGGKAFDSSERSALGLDHAEIGALILRSWSFPEHLVRAVRWHHRPDECPVPDPVVDIVHVADAVAMMLGFNEGIEGLTYNISPSVAQRLELGADDLEEVAIETLLAVESIEAAVQS